MIVPYGLPIGLLKCDKWHLAKNSGSMGWFVCGFQFDPSLHGAMMWLKKRGFLGSVQPTDGTGCAIPQKIPFGFEKIACINVCSLCPLSYTLIRAGVYVQGPLVYLNLVSQIFYCNKQTYFFFE